MEAKKAQVMDLMSQVATVLSDMSQQARFHSGNTLTQVLSSNAFKVSALATLEGILFKSCRYSILIASEIDSPQLGIEAPLVNDSESTQKLVNIKQVTHLRKSSR
jgi:hypothetical protein